MKKLITLAFLLAATPSALADLSHSISSSVKLTVGGASTSASRLGSSYSVSGVGVDQRMVLVIMLLLMVLVL